MGNTALEGRGGSKGLQEEPRVHSKDRDKGHLEGHVKGRLKGYMKGHPEGHAKGRLKGSGDIPA